MDQLLTSEDADRIIPRILEFPDIQAKFERLKPITDFRKDEGEARILYLCRRLPEQDSVHEDAEKTELVVLKCKVQVPSVLPGGITEPLPGPSEQTAAEIHALSKFKETNSEGLPHLISWKCMTQDDCGLMPGGYISLTLMTLMPGQHLMDLKFWSLYADDKEEIREAFLPVIKHVWRLGFEPYDCALRNILWDAATKRLSLVDFEHWHIARTNPINMNDQEEMQRWGIAQRPAFTSHWQEWFHAERLTRKRDDVQTLPATVQ